METLPWRDEIGRVIRHHHEHYDGNGYPDGLRGEEIPLLSRLVSVADSYDAMSESRPYHPERSPAQVMAILRTERGRKYDPKLVDLVQYMDKPLINNPS